MKITLECIIGNILKVEAGKSEGTDIETVAVLQANEKHEGES